MPPIVTAMKPERREDAAAVELQRDDRSDHHARDAADRRRDRVRDDRHQPDVDPHERRGGRIFRARAQRFAERRLLQHVPQRERRSGRVAPASHGDLGREPQSRTISYGREPENGSSWYGWLPQHSKIAPSNSVSIPRGQDHHAAGRQLAQRRLEDELREQRADRRP